MRSKIFLMLIILCFSINLSICHAFTFDGDFNYQTPSLGVVHFSRDITATVWDTWNTLTRWQGVIWGTNTRGIFAIDISNGCTVNVTSMQAQTLIYDVVAVGAETQTVYYRGLGRPGSIAGGTYAIVGNNVVVTTNGNTTVTINWDQELYHEIADQISSYMVIFALTPVVMAAAAIISLGAGAMDAKTAVKIIGVTVAIALMTVIIGVYMKI